MTLAPIALFVYNRPEHTRNTLDNLLANYKFSDTSLYVFCDGAKSKKDISLVQETRELIHSYRLQNATIMESEENKGLAKSIIDGINYILEKHDRVIVLEDDCVPSKDFINFMNLCFDKYEKNEQIMNLTGYAPPINIPSDYPYDIYFSYRSSSWGWGTWKRAWKYYNRNSEILQEINSSKLLRYKVDRAGMDLYPMLKAQLEGKLDSWSIFWSLTIIKNDGLCINPVESRIINIGHDGTGVHCNPNNRYTVKINKNIHKGIVFPDNIQPDVHIVKSYQKFMNEPFLKKLINFCRRKIVSIYKGHV